MKRYLLTPMLFSLSSAWLFAAKSTPRSIPSQNNQPAVCTAASEQAGKSLPQGVRYSCVDESTQAHGMHVCPVNFVLTGASNSNNRFLCTWVGPIQNTYVSSGSNREEQVYMGGYNSLSCKAGFLTLGINILENRMYCGEVVRATKPTSETRRQVTTKASIEACPATIDPESLSAMKGWNQSYSTMICETITLVPKDLKASR